MSHFDFDAHFKTGLARDVANMVLGDLHGYGTTRAIYTHATDPTLMVKVETDAGSYNNIMEWEAWKSVKDTEFAKWFAPCVQISGAGLVLTMKKCTVATARELPRKVPAFFTDLKAENWGWYEDRFVCLDYGLHLLHELGMTKRMRTANWEKS